MRLIRRLLPVLSVIVACVLVLALLLRLEDRGAGDVTGKRFAGGSSNQAVNIVGREGGAPGGLGSGVSVPGGVSRDRAAEVEVPSAIQPQAPALAGDLPESASPEVDFSKNYIVIGGHRAHPHRLLGRVKPEAAGSAAAALAAQEMGVLRRSSLSAGDVTLAALRPVMDAVASHADAESRGEAMQRRIKSLLDSGAFEYVEPDYIVGIQQAVPSDAAFADGRLWALRNNGQSSGLAGADIDVVRAWGLTSGVPEVIVAVIDSGVRYTHGDLAGQMWRNPGESGALAANGIDDDRDGFADNVFGLNAQKNTGDPIDEHGHGTFCAGIIAAQADGGGASVGVAPRVRIMACRFLDAQGTGSSSDAIKSIGFAVAKGARILNNSWGGGGYSQAMHNAILAARAKGALFIAAAGNEGTDNDALPRYPASYAADNILAVAALDRGDKLAAFSSFGANSVHLGAPGVAIFSTGRTADTAYVSGSGTSAAAPHVAGVAALVLSRFPGLPLAELRQRILAGVVPIPALRDKASTGGRLNAFNALSGAPDGVLEVSVTPAAGTLVAPGSSLPVFVRVHDIAPVTNATVLVTVPGAATPVSLRNDGLMPDATAGDGVYSGRVALPATGADVALKFAVAAPDKKSAELAVTLPLRPPPVNDSFARRLPISASAPSVTETSEGSTREAGEPVHAGREGGASVWWTWTAPVSGKAIVTTRGSSFDTLLAVYTGAVDGFRGAAGAVSLSVSVAPESVGAAPAHDLFANAAPLAGPVVALLSSNAGAGREMGEPEHAGVAGAGSVWWRWTAPAAGTVTLATDGSSFDTLLAVYTGAKVDALSVVASDDDGGEGPRSLVSFTAVAGTEYRIAVDGKDGATGLIALRVVLALPKPAPANDAFAKRIPISGAPDSAGLVRVTGSNVGASEEEGEPDHAGNLGGRSVWWTWTAPGDGIATISTAGSSFNTVLAVYTGGSLATLVPVAANDQDPAGGNTSRVSFAARAGSAYQIVVDGARIGLSAESGSVALRLSLAAGATVPANDAFASAAVLTGAKVAWSGFNVGATAESGEPEHAGRPAARSVWFSWTAPKSGMVTAGTAGSGVDTLLAVYAGSDVTALSRVVANDDDGASRASRVVFQAVEGTAYRLAIDGVGGATGQISLVLSLAEGQTGPANDAFAAAAPVPWPVVQPMVMPPPPLAVSLRASNSGAGRESGEPRHAGREGGASVWWRFTAARSGMLEINTAGSGFESILALYRGEALERLVSLGGDAGAPGRPFALVRAFVTAGASYVVAVDGVLGAQGALTLNFKLDAASDLYATHFDLFPPGADKLVGADGWMGAVDPGSSGIGESQSGARFAWIGRTAAATRDVVSVRRPIGHDPVAAGTPLIVFSADVTVAPSTNGRRDAFQFTVRNLAGEELGSIRLDLADLSLSRVDRGSPGSPVKAAAPLIAGETRRLVAMLDFGRNRWTATYGADTLWVDQPLTARVGAALNLGDIAVSWLIGSVGSPGDNFLSFDNYRVAVAEPVAFVAQPKPQAVAAGQPVVFSVVAVGSPPPQFQWQRKPAGGSAFSDIVDGADYAGVRSPALTVKAATVAMSGDEFRCLIVNAQPVALVSAPALLSVGKGVQEVVFVDPPRDRPFGPQAIELRAVSSSGQPVTFSLVSGPAKVEANQLLLAGVGTVRIRASVAATDSLGASAAVEHAFDVFRGIPVITWNPPPQMSLGTTLSAAQLNASASPAGGTFTYKPAAGAVLSSPGPVSLTVTYVPAAADAANYAGITVQRPVLVGGAAGAPVIVRQPVSQTVPVGLPVALEVLAMGENLSFQWFKGEVAIIGANRPVLAFAAFAAADAGTYRVEVSGGGAKVVSQPAVLGIAGSEISASHSVTGAISPSSSTITIRNTLSFAGTPAGIGWSALIPRGWALVSVAGQVGDVAPQTGATDALEWAWTSVPASPVIFSYTLSVPAGESGPRSIAAFAVVRAGGESGGFARILARPDPLLVGRGRRHDVDVNGDGRLSLIELTRLIELYNTRHGTARTGAYAIAPAGSEDGFTPEPLRAAAVVATLDRHHSADTDRDGKLSLMELTRVIELYNTRSGTTRTGEYRESDGTEDGFAPGP
ncbi:MAG: hypothetical protein RLZZ188_2983 [Verrucomicrobiota bacterium]